MAPVVVERLTQSAGQRWSSGPAAWCLPGEPVRSNRGPRAAQAGACPSTWVGDPAIVGGLPAL